MGVRQRIEKYRKVGGASDLVRVEVLVPEKSRGEILAQAAEHRLSHRKKLARLQFQIDTALKHYSVRVGDNIDLNSTSDITQKSRMIANALIERGDARAFLMGRKLLSEIEG